MAEVVLGAVAEHLVNEALSLGAEEFSLVFHFKDGLQKLATEFEIIQALLADADDKNIQSAAKNLWLKRLKAVASDAEDVLEEYRYELLRHKVNTPQKKWNKVRSFFTPIRKLAFRLKMGHNIKDINAQLKSVKEQGIGYGLNAEFPNRSLDVNRDRLTSPSVQEKEIVGRDNDVIKVVGMLLNAKNEEDLAVIGIVGMGGQGKTALAQLIYKNDKVVNHFQQRIWICVSDDFKIERVLNEMVQSITRENSTLTNREALIKKLQETLKDKRYLLVLDDVWNENEEKWECMEKDLRAISGSIGTKVMIITRNEKVVSIMHACQTHYLSKLSAPDSWTLFRNRAFANGGAKETPDFVEIGRRMVERCGGMPLAIKALGGLLYSKKDISEWLSIEKSDIWSLSNSQEGVLPSIKLSYNHLSSLSLKQCFAYCSIFPKDHAIDKEDLIQLWMAQGFLNPPKGSPLQMEELGDAYFNTLLWNSLLQEPAYNGNNKIEYCKMHDIVHDFALIISKDYCFTVKAEQDDKNIEAVHLSLISDKYKFVDLFQGISSRLRTLYLQCGVVENELIKFRCLRTLILGDTNIKELPTSIGRLKQLRYIDIKKSRIRTLPASYVKLFNLQTLKFDLEDESGIFLGSLINLRHIDSNPCKLMGINLLIHLQTLPYFTVEKREGCKIEELGPLNNLRGKLTIYGLDKVKDGEEARKANLFGKPKVEHLKLCWAEEGRDAWDLNDEDVLEGLRPHSYLKRLKIENFMGSRFPSWMTNLLLQNLVKFTLEGCKRLVALPMLQGFPSLEVLVIKDAGVDSLPGMPSSLRNLYIEGCEKLAALPSLQDLLFLEELSVIGCAGVDSLPDMPSSLRYLYIKRCEKLAALPSLQDLLSLEELLVFECAGVVSIPNMSSSLRKMTIKRCENLFAVLSLEGLLSLENLVFRGRGKVFLPNMLLSLRSLRVKGCQLLGPLPSSLEHLEMKDVEVDSLPDMLPCGLPSLRSMIIMRCKKLVALPRGLELCTLLRGIEILHCPALQGIDGSGLERLPNLKYLHIGGGFSQELDYFPWPHSTMKNYYGVDAQLYFPSLEVLTLYGWRKLTSLPDKLQHLPSLTSLSIWGFGGLEALPEWLGRIQSLQSLYLVSCHNLEYFPSAEAMQRLTNLQRLKIYYCPHLEERCTRGSGPEWNKIAHIPDIRKYTTLLA